MQLIRLSTKTQYSSRFTGLVIITSSICAFYFLLSIFLVPSPKLVFIHSSLQHVSYAPTTLEHIVFGIASNKKGWPHRKEYVSLWWKPNQTRGCAFLDEVPPDDNQEKNGRSQFPPICISGNTSMFQYTSWGGHRSAIRVARVVSETVALNNSNVRWYVFGDDDTVFFPENLVKTLSKYDHRLWYYIGSNSEIHEQNMFFNFEMAFGGGGFAISYPLAKILAKFFDSCIKRYPHLYGSDVRVYSCLAELGVSLTHEPGFHQVDIHGDIFGLLSSHPLTPLVSLHHFDFIDPLFPNMKTIEALNHLFKAVNVDSQRILQQSVCYDRWYTWTISVSWGYAVQIYENHLLLPDVLVVPETFIQWKPGNVLSAAYNFNTRKPHPDTCKRPTIFYFNNVSSSINNRGEILTTYLKYFDNCPYDMASPKKLKEIRVFSQKLNLDIKQLQAPRRHCCEVLPSSRGEVMDITIRECNEDEFVHMYAR